MFYGTEVDIYNNRCVTWTSEMNHELESGFKMLVWKKETRWKTSWYLVFVTRHSPLLWPGPAPLPSPVRHLLSYPDITLTGPLSDWPHSSLLRSGSSPGPAQAALLRSHLTQTITQSVFSCQYSLLFTWNIRIKLTTATVSVISVNVQSLYLHSAPQPPGLPLSLRTCPSVSPHKY